MEEVKPLRILVVHPDDTISEEIARGVRAGGHDPLFAPDGERAIDLFVQDPADALIVNLTLPGRDGVATVDSMRWAPGGERLPVILIGTNSPAPRVKELAARIGATGFVTGRVSADVIRELIERLSSKGAPLTRVVSAYDPSVSETAQVPVAAAIDSVEDPNTDSTDVRAIRGTMGDPVAIREGQDVERRAAEGAAARLSGRLREIPFPRLIARLAEQKASGALVVRAGTDRRATTTGESPKKVVFFRTGVPRYVRSNMLSECLGQVLAQTGRISQATLQESVQRVLEGAGRQGGILIAMGALTPSDLREALEEQQRRKLFDLFGWEEGEFGFHDEPVPEMTVTIEMSLSELVYQGIKLKLSPERLLKELEPHFEHYLIPVPARIRPFLQMDLPKEARRVLAAIDGSHKLKELIELGAPRPGATAQLLYALETTLAATFREEAARIGPVAVDGMATGRETGRFAAHDLVALREELERLVRLLREERLAEALGCDPSDGEAVRKAVEQLDARIRPATEAGAAPRELRALAMEGIARLARAKASEGLTRLERMTPAGPHVADNDEEVDELTPISEGLDTPEDPETLDERPGRRDTEPDDPPSRPVAPVPTLTLGTAVTLDQEVETILSAERFFRRGEKALGKGRADEAFGQFARAIELCPEEGEFLAYLGYARFLSAPGDPQSRARALDELNRGSRLAPKLDVTHVLRARVLAEMGENVAARNAYERALAANPRCREALEALRSLPP